MHLPLTFHSVRSLLYSSTVGQKGVSLTNACYSEAWLKKYHLGAETRTIALALLIWRSTHTSLNLMIPASTYILLLRKCQQHQVKPYNNLTNTQKQTPIYTLLTHTQHQHKESRLELVYYINNNHSREEGRGKSEIEFDLTHCARLHPLQQPSV